MLRGAFKTVTRARNEFVDITKEVQTAISGAASGILYLFNPHTTAGLTINEGADPAVCRDLLNALGHIVPENLDYQHLEGNSPAHLKTLLTGSSLTLEVEAGQLVLGSWQRIFFCEYDGPRTRTVRWQLVPTD
jgi:secondary thiamine-phosphate synthase enzyme